MIMISRWYFASGFLFRVIATYCLIFVPVLISSLSSSFSTAKEKFVLSGAMEVTKASQQQHPLLKWLTNPELNKHFNRDAEEGIIFLINEEGVLYGVHSRQISSDMLKHVMEQNIRQGTTTEHKH